MPNITKKDFFTILRYTTGPKLWHRDLGQWYECTQYRNILLDYESIDIEAIKELGVDAKRTLDKSRSIMLATIRFNIIDRPGNDWKKRFEDKMNKYRRWLDEGERMLWKLNQRDDSPCIERSSDEKTIASNGESSS